MNGLYKDFSVNRKVQIEDWNEAAGWPSGKKVITKELQKYLLTIQEKLFQRERQLYEGGEAITLENLLAEFLDVKKVTKVENTLSDLVELHNKHVLEEFQANIIVKATYLKFVTTKRYLSEFTIEKYKSPQFLVSRLSLEYLLDFEHWLKTKKGCCQNTTNKYLKCLKKIVRMGIDRNLIKGDPFRAYKIKNVLVNRNCLSLQEILEIENLQTGIDRINKVRDYFLFSCYTGLSYSDVVSLKPIDLLKDPTGDIWVQKERQKTGVLSRVPLIKKANELLNKYENDPTRKYRETIFAPISNQKLNAYLKEIADLTGIQKKLTFHIARHTFATTITLAKGVSIETVSAALGHTNIKQTQLYAKMTNNRIKHEMRLAEEGMQG